MAADTKVLEFGAVHRTHSWRMPCRHLMTSLWLVAVFIQDGHDWT